jgi:predicted Zn-dependent peptidase
LYVVGRFDLDRAEAQVRHYLGGWPSGVAVAALDIPPPSPMPGLVVVVDDDAPNQIAISLAFTTSAEIDADRAQRLLLTEILRHRLSLLREREGVTYGGTVVAQSFRAAGSMTIEVSVDPRYAVSAVASLEQMVEDLRRQPPAAVELARARRIVVRAILAGHQTSSERAIALAARDALGRTQSDEDLLTTLTAVTGEELRAQAARLLPASGQVLLLSGKREHIDRAVVALRRKPDQTITRPESDE